MSSYNKNQYDNSVDSSSDNQSQAQEVNSKNCLVVRKICSIGYQNLNNYFLTLQQLIKCQSLQTLHNKQIKTPTIYGQFNSQTKGYPFRYNLLPNSKQYKQNLIKVKLWSTVQQSIEKATLFGTGQLDLAKSILTCEQQIQIQIFQVSTQSKLVAIIECNLLNQQNIFGNSSNQIKESFQSNQDRQVCQVIQKSYLTAKKRKPSKNVVNMQTQNFSEKYSIKNQQQIQLSPQHQQEQSVSSSVRNRLLELTQLLNSNLIETKMESQVYSRFIDQNTILINQLQSEAGLKALENFNQSNYLYHQQIYHQQSRVSSERAIFGMIENTRLFQSFLEDQNIPPKISYGKGFQDLQSSFNRGLILNNIQINSKQHPSSLSFHLKQGKKNFLKKQKQQSSFYLSQSRQIEQNYLEDSILEEYVTLSCLQQNGFRKKWNERVILPDQYQGMKLFVKTQQGQMQCSINKDQLLAKSKEKGKASFTLQRNGNKTGTCQFQWKKYEDISIQTDELIPIGQFQQRLFNRNSKKQLSNINYLSQLASLQKIQEPNLLSRNVTTTQRKFNSIIRRENTQIDKNINRKNNYKRHIAVSHSFLQNSDTAINSLQPYQKKRYQSTINNDGTFKGQSNKKQKMQNQSKPGKKHKYQKNKFDAEYQLNITTISLGLFSLNNFSSQVPDYLQKIYLNIQYEDEKNETQNYKTESKLKEFNIMWKSKQCKFQTNRNGQLKIYCYDNLNSENQYRGQALIKMSQLLALINVQLQDRDQFSSKINKSNLFQSQTTKKFKDNHVSIAKMFIFNQQNILGQIIIGYSIKVLKEDSQERLGKRSCLLPIQDISIPNILQKPNKIFEKKRYQIYDDYDNNAQQIRSQKPYKFQKQEKQYVRAQSYQQIQSNSDVKGPRFNRRSTNITPIGIFSSPKIIDVHKPPISKPKEQRRQQNWTDLTKQLSSKKKKQLSPVHRQMSTLLQSKVTRLYRDPKRSLDSKNAQRIDKIRVSLNQRYKGGNIKFPKAVRFRTQSQIRSLRSQPGPGYYDVPSQFLRHYLS